MEENLKSLLEECSAAFRETGEYSILDTYRSRHSMLTMDDRLAIFKSVNIIFKPVFDQIKSDAPSLSETDLVFCALSVQGFETVAIAECLAVSKEAVRIRKFRMREKMNANLFALLFGETKRYTSETVTLQTNANPDVPIPLSHEPLKKTKVMEKNQKKKMSFGKAVGVCMSKLFTFEGRARRSEYWYFCLFVFILDFSLRVAGMVYDNCILCCEEEDASVFRYSGSIIELIEYVVISFMGLSVAVRRLHDIECNGWLALLFVVLPFFLCIVMRHALSLVLSTHDISPFIIHNALSTIISPVFLLLVIGVVQVVLFCISGTEGPNAYGHDPICCENEPNNVG